MINSLKPFLASFALCCASGLSGGHALADTATETPAPTLTLVMEGKVDIGLPRAMGETPLGLRREIPITGGAFTGPDITAEVLPGGSDWQLQRKDGGLEIVAEYTLKTDDGEFIKVRNQGISFRPSETREGYTMTTPQFEAPEGKYQWLNEAVFVGTLRLSGDTPPKVLIGVYKAEPGQ
ncbi:MAG: hypothetical protein CMK07_10020 [Ponticaulis sp.]|nr:hypothetical protein [Ponticaulis sp.]